jgi:hypothetical protein
MVVPIIQGMGQRFRQPLSLLQENAGFGRRAM